MKKEIDLNEKLNFSLSGKVKLADIGANDYDEYLDRVFLENDVKEAVRILKEELNDEITKEVLDAGFEPMIKINIINKKIDKIFGEKLTK